MPCGHSEGQRPELHLLGEAGVMGPHLIRGRSSSLCLSSRVTHVPALNTCSQTNIPKCHSASLLHFSAKLPGGGAWLPGGGACMLHTYFHFSHCLSLASVSHFSTLSPTSGTPATPLLPHPLVTFQLVHSFICAFFHLFVRSFSHSSIHLLIHSSSHLLIHSSLIHSFICSVISSSIHPFILSFTHLLIHWLIRSFIHSLTHSFAHLLVH